MSKCFALNQITEILKYKLQQILMGNDLFQRILKRK